MIGTMITTIAVISRPQRRLLVIHGGVYQTSIGRDTHIIGQIKPDKGVYYPSHPRFEESVLLSSVQA